jgi:hypothetical protein
MALPTYSAGLKLERAKQHRAELETALSVFKGSKPYTIAALQRPETPQLLFYYVAELKDIPADIPLICGDVLQNLRSSLDHMAGQLVISAGNSVSNHTAFPIFENAAKYRSGVDQRVELMRPDAIRAINALEPYGGGRGDTLWRLHKLNNIDKHRAIFTAGSLVAAIDALPHWARMAPQLLPLMEAGYAFIPQDKSFPLQVGSLVFETLETAVDQNLKFSFDVALGHPDVCYGEPVLQTVTELTEAVENVLVELAPLL